METKIKTVNTKALVFSILDRALDGREFPALKVYVEAVFAGRYGASKALGRELQGYVLSEALGSENPSLNVMVANLLNQLVIYDGDTFRRYCHEWRKMRQFNTEKSQPETK